MNQDGKTADGRGGAGTTGTRRIEARRIDARRIEARRIEARPLTARSLIASLLLGTIPPELAGQRLVRVAERFGFTETATRVALSRMVAAGELAGQGGRYRLAGALLDRYGRQEEGRRPHLRPWDGTWNIAVVGAAGGRRPAAERAALRRRLAGLRLAEWREGVWLRPDNLDGERPDVDGCVWWTGARPLLDADAVPLAGALWDLGGWAEQASELIAALGIATPGSVPIPQSFGVAASVVRHLAADPLLPAELLPPGWPGEGLRHAYQAYEAALQAVLRPVLAGEPDGTPAP